MGACLLTGFFLGWNAFAQSGEVIDPMNLPSFTQYVNDYSNVLSSGEIAELNTMAEEYEKRTSTQIVTVLFPHRQDYALLDIGVKAFREHGIGQKDDDNGLLLLIATDEKKLRIIVGYGLEGAMPDATASDIVEFYLRDAVNSGDFVTAVREFYAQSIAEIDSAGDVFTGENSTSSSSESSGDDGFGLLFMLGIAAGIFSFRMLKQRKVFDKNANAGFYWLGQFALLFWGMFLGFEIFTFMIGHLLSSFVSLMFSLPPGTWGGSGWSSSSWGSSSSSSRGSSSSSSSSSSWGFSWWGGSTWGGGAGD